MEQKDYILREIEKISVLLRYLLGKIVPSDKSETIFTKEQLNRELAEELGIDLNELTKITPEAFIAELSRNEAFNLGNMELLADLFVQAALNKMSNKIISLTHALELYQYIDKTGSTYSFERATKIQTVLKLLT